MSVLTCPILSNAMQNSSIWQYMAIYFSSVILGSLWEHVFNYSIAKRKLLMCQHVGAFTCYPMLFEKGHCIYCKLANMNMYLPYIIVEHALHIGAYM